MPEQRLETMKSPIQENEKTSSNLTRRQCNKCKVYKSQTSFDVNKCTSKECNANQVNCPYCSPSVRFS